MKKLKHIPLLALTALMSGCNLFGGVKAPKFDSEGEETTYIGFREKYLEALRDSELRDEESKLTDRVLKRSYSSTTRETVKRDKKEISTIENQIIATGESQFDVDNLVGKMSAEMKNTSKVQSQEQNSTSTSNSSFEQFIQFDKVKGSTYLIVANTKTNSYYTGDRISTGNTQEDVFDNNVRQELLSIIPPFDEYMPVNLMDGSDNLFYVYDDIRFTYTKAKEADDNSYGAYTQYTKIVLKAQLDLTDKKQAFRLSYEYKEELTYRTNSDGHYKGDVVTNEQKIYYDYVITAKNVNVKPVDISNFLSPN